MSPTHFYKHKKLIPYFLSIYNPRTRCNRTVVPFLKFTCLLFYLFYSFRSYILCYSTCNKVIYVYWLVTL